MKVMAGQFKDPKLRKVEGVYIPLTCRTEGSYTAIVLTPLDSGWPHGFALSP